MQADPMARQAPRAGRLLITLACTVLLAACGAPAWKKPVPMGQVDFMSRAASETRGDLTVTVAVPDREETEQLFGTSLYSDQIQPVWISVDNRSDHDYLLMRVGVDEAYFSPLEAAYLRHSGSKEIRHEMDLFFYGQNFENPVAAGAVTSGYVLTNLDEGAKAINVDLVGDRELENFTFVVKVPGLLTDSSRVDFDTLYEEVTDLQDPGELRRVLESLPCCTTSKDGSEQGDPLNVVMIGDRLQMFSALIRRGWHQTEVTYGASAMRTVKSFMFGTRYRYSPISPLYVFGRSQDVGLQKARESIHLRNHMRLWRTPYTFRGKEVYVGQISRDIGVKFNKRTITTHAIDPDVDDTRNGLIGDLAYSQSLHTIAYVTGSQVSTLKDTHYNLTPDPYYSDGLRAVLFFSERAVSLDEIDILNWETPKTLEGLGSP